MGYGVGRSVIVEAAMRYGELLCAAIIVAFCADTVMLFALGALVGATQDILWYPNPAKGSEAR